jgi:hypothetical protein
VKVCLGSGTDILRTGTDVRFGSKADIEAGPRHDRFTSNSGHHRILAGLKRAVAQGKHLGRPRIDPALEKLIQAQLRGGKGMHKVALECGVGTGTVQRVRQEMEGPFVGVAA